MKKKIIATLLTSCIALACIGCGDNKSENSNSSNSQQSTVIDQPTSTPTEQPTDAPINQVDDTATNTIDTEPTAAPTEEPLVYETINFGEMIALDFVEWTVDSAACTQEIFPTDTSSVYSYMPDQENEQYWYITGTIKNISAETYNVEYIAAELCFDDKYKYDAYLIADDGGRDFYGQTVKPFGSVKYYIYASVPDELIGMYTTCTVKFAFEDNFDNYRPDFDECKYFYQVTVSK